MPSTLNVYINAFWLLMLCGIVGALIRLHQKVKQAHKKHSQTLTDLQQQQDQQIKRIEVLEHKHQSILQNLAHVFEHLNHVTPH